jgi:hypothetical protein
MLLPITGEIKEKRPEETKLTFTDELYKYIIDKQDRYIKKEYVSLDTNNLYKQSEDGTEFSWYYSGTTVSQQRGSISTLYYIKNITHMRWYSNILLTYGTYTPLAEGRRSSINSGINVLLEQNTISIAIKELATQSFHSTEGLNYHFMGKIKNNSPLVNDYENFLIDLVPYSDGYFYFNRPINLLNTISTYFGNPFQKIPFPLYFNNFNISYTLNPADIYIDLLLPYNMYFMYINFSLSNPINITIYNFTTSDPTNLTDQNLINLINQEYGYSYIFIPPIIVNGIQCITYRAIVPYSGPINYTPIGIPSNNVNCYLKLFRFIFNVEFSFIDDGQIKNDFMERGIQNILKRELYFRPERLFKTTKIILNTDYNIAPYGTDCWKWNLNDFNLYITNNTNTNDLIENIVGIKFRDFKLNTCFGYYPYSPNVRNYNLYILIEELISHFYNLENNYQGVGLLETNITNGYNIKGDFGFKNTNNGYLWLNKVQQNLTTITLSMNIFNTFIGELETISNNIIQGNFIIYFAYWPIALPGVLSNPGCMFFYGFNYPTPLAINFNNYFKVYINGFTTPFPTQDVSVINEINSPNGIWGRYWEDPISLNNFFILPTITFNRFYDNTVVQGTLNNFYIKYFEFQLPIDIYQLKTENDFIQSDYL